MTGTLLPIVKTFQKALDIVAAQTKGRLNITLVKAELELSATVTTEAKAGLKFHFVFDVDIGGSLGGTRGNSLTVALTPVTAKALGAKEESDDLAAAIVAMAEEVLEVKRAVAGQFDVGDFEVLLRVARSIDGQLEVVGSGGSRTSEGGHSFKLTFRTN
jgi:hypothetical protein